MKQRYELILAGSGGQGLVFLGKTLGEAAIVENRNVVQTQTYGIAQRGGLSSSEIVIDSDEITYQQVITPDAILALSESAIRSYSKPGQTAPLVYDSGVLSLEDKEGWYGYPFAELAMKDGNERMANLLALGAMLKLFPAVKLESIEKFFKRNFGEQVAVKNMEALYKGAKLVENGR
ncbi:MAG: 2-oxoacid:ferredoxin oxidoreductase, gamma subunit [Firmicutes bacterium]|nr:2-oxoacid:ferredoxin oxidoreductase, gamma subunit [Bacillota bacterium]